jgi:3-dehydrosphinganine reductase
MAQSITAWMAPAAAAGSALLSEATRFVRDPRQCATAYLLVPALAALAGLLLHCLARALRGACSSSSSSLRGKLVLVTGGSSGIGKAVALDFARRGAHVVILARSVAKLEAAADEIMDACASKEQAVAYLSCDVTDRAQVRACVAECAELHGAPDYLITSHGAAYPGYFFDQDEDVFEKTMRLNYMGNVNVVKAVAPLMRARGSGHIVVVASAAAVVSFIGYTSYSPSKFALRGFADALRSEMNGFGIRVSIAYPPDTDTAGFAKEKEMAPPETALCFPADPFSARSVAGTMVASILLGDYHIQGPDPLQNLLVSSMSGVTPRPFLAVEVVLAPLLMLVEQLFWPWFDYQARCYSGRAGGGAEGEDEQGEKEKES